MIKFILVSPYYDMEHFGYPSDVVLVSIDEKIIFFKNVNDLIIFLIAFKHKAFIWEMSFSWISDIAFSTIYFFDLLGHNGIDGDSVHLR